jgi:hypothetical protein
MEDRMVKIARQISQQAAAEAGKRAPGAAQVSAKVSVNPRSDDAINRRQNPADHSFSSVRHHQDEGGTFVPSLDEMPQTAVRPPGRRDYDNGGTDQETPRGGFGHKSGRHSI